MSEFRHSDPDHTVSSHSCSSPGMQAFHILLNLYETNYVWSLQKPVYRVPYVNVCTIRDLGHSRVKIDDVPRCLASMQMGAQPL